MTPPFIVEGGTEALDGVMDVMARAFDPAYGEAWNRGQCLAMLGLPGVWLTVARDAGQATLGFALMRQTLDEAELLLIAVCPDRRGRGLGGQILDHVTAAAAGRGVKRLHLEVRDGNPARRLYEGRGFALQGRRPGYYGGHGGQRHDALTLARDIVRG